MKTSLKIMLLGPPGSGKGTQSKLLVNSLGIPEISMGDMLRSSMNIEDELGKQIKHIIQTGDLVPDEIVITLLKQRLTMPDCERGFILDGFPRTATQAEALNAADIALDCVVLLTISDDEIIARLSGRFVHLTSGRSYHILHNPPLVAGIDDITGEPLTQRPDDQIDTIKQRLAVYHHHTKPLITYYQDPTKFTGKYYQIDALQDINIIHQQIIALL